MSRHVGLYRRLLALYPAAFRAEYGDEMARLFADQLRDARHAGGAVAVAGLWAETAPTSSRRRSASTRRRGLPWPVPSKARSRPWRSNRRGAPAAG